MKKTKLEQISSLVDDEYEGDSKSPIDNLLKDADLRTAWQSYHEFGDWMRGDADGYLVSVDVAERVRNALEAEPTLLIPANRHAAPVEQSRPKYWSQFAGVGIAAAVASVTVMLFQQADPLSAGDSRSLVAANPPSSVAVSVAAVDSAAGNDMHNASPAASDDFQRKLDAYLASHVRQSAGHGAQGLLPNVTVVDYGSAPK